MSRDAAMRYCNEYHNNPAIVEDIDGNVQVRVEAVQATK